MEDYDVTGHVKALQPYLKRKVSAFLKSNNQKAAEVLAGIVCMRQMCWTVSEWHSAMEVLEKCQLTVAEWLAQNTVMTDNSYITKVHNPTDEIDPCS